MTTETKTKVIALLKMVLTFAGTFLLGHTFLGQALTTETLDTLFGVVLTLVAVIWSIADNSATIEVIESSTRVILTGGGGFLVSAGLIKAPTLAALIGSIPLIIAVIQSFASKTKVVQMEKGTLVAKVSLKTGELTGKVEKPKAAA